MLARHPLELETAFSAPDQLFAGQMRDDIHY
jgi:hypothetical protein